MDEPHPHFEALAAVGGVEEHRSDARRENVLEFLPDELAVGDIRCVGGGEVGDPDEGRRIEPCFHAVAEVWPRDGLSVPFCDVDVLAVRNVWRMGRGCCHDGGLGEVGGHGGYVLLLRLLGLEGELLRGDQLGDGMHKNRWVE